jgi:hypothetical protein
MDKMSEQELNNEHDEALDVLFSAFRSIPNMQTRMRAAEKLAEALEQIADKAENAEGYDRLLPVIAQRARAALEAWKEASK